MPHACRRSGALVGALGIVLAGCGRGPAPAAQTADEEPLLVVQDRGPLVVSARDTTMVLAPTVFAWSDVGPNGAPADADAFTRFQQSLRGARPGLERMGVRVVALGAPAVVVELPAGADAAGAPMGPPAASGYLLLDIDGHLERRDGVLDATALVCLASLTFRLAAPGC